MKQIIEEPLNEYLSKKTEIFKDNDMAKKFRDNYPKLLSQIIIDNERYMTAGSAGKGVWTYLPWIAIFDKLVTKTAQSGYYIVFLFQEDMKGVYLSLNQGVKEVTDNYKKRAIDVLKIRAIDYRAKLNWNNGNLDKIYLNSKRRKAKLYEAGNIIAKHYSINNLPSSEKLKKDILQYIEYYNELTYNDTHLSNEDDVIATEKKQYRFHRRIERNNSISKKVKDKKGYICEVCGFDFTTKYGSLGKKYIEAHHLTPISKLDFGKFKVNIKNDFAVLCSNCHRMIHKMEDCGDIEGLKRIIKNTIANNAYKK